MKPGDKAGIKQKLIHAWIKYIGVIPRPPCAKCSYLKVKPQKVNALTVDFDLQRDEIMIILECHGEKDITRIPHKKAYEIAKIEFFEAFKRDEAREKLLH